MARRKYTEDQFVATAAMLRTELSGTIERNRTFSADDFQSARRHVAMRNYRQGDPLPIMSNQPDHVELILDLICQM